MIRCCVLEQNLLPWGSQVECYGIKDSLRGGGEMICICPPFNVLSPMWRCCSTDCEARIWITSPHIVSAAQVTLFLVDTGVYFVKLMDGFRGCNFVLKKFIPALLWRNPLPSLLWLFKLVLILSRAEQLVWSSYTIGKGESICTWGVLAGVGCYTLWCQMLKAHGWPQILLPS